MLQLILKHIINSSASEVQQPSGQRPKTAHPITAALPPRKSGGQIHVSPHACFTSSQTGEQCSLCVHKLTYEGGGRICMISFRPQHTRGAAVRFI